MERSSLDIYQILPDALTQSMIAGCFEHKELGKSYIMRPSKPSEKNTNMGFFWVLFFRS